MNTHGNSLPPKPASSARAPAPAAIADFALRDLVQPIAPPTSAPATGAHLPASELRPVIAELAHVDPLSVFQSRQQIAAKLIADTEAAASGVKAPPATKGPGGAMGGQHSKAHQPSQKWVTRRFA